MMTSDWMYTGTVPRTATVSLRTKLLTLTTTTPKNDSMNVGTAQDLRSSRNKLASTPAVTDMAKADSAHSGVALMNAICSGV